MWNLVSKILQIAVHLKINYWYLTTFLSEKNWSKQYEIFWNYRFLHKIFKNGLYILRNTYASCHTMRLFLNENSWEESKWINERRAVALNQTLDFYGGISPTYLLLKYLGARPPKVCFILKNWMGLFSNFRIRTTNVHITFCCWFIFK